MEAYTHVPSVVLGEEGVGAEEEGLRTSIREVWRLQGQPSRKEVWLGPNGL